MIWRKKKKYFKGTATIAPYFCTAKRKPDSEIKGEENTFHTFCSNILLINSVYLHLQQPPFLDLQFSKVGDPSLPLPVPVARGLRARRSAHLPGLRVDPARVRLQGLLLLVGVLALGELLQLAWNVFLGKKQIVKISD